MAAIFITTSAFAAQVTIRSDGKYSPDPGTWIWTGPELGDVDDATYATTDRANRTLHSSVANDPAYSGCTINWVQVWVRASQTIGNERFDYGLYNPLDTTDYLTGTPFILPGGSSWTSYSNTWNTRPWGGAWTPADVDGLVVTARSLGNARWDGVEQLSEVWVVVDYTCLVNTPPTVTITTPVGPVSFNEGDNVSFGGTAIDGEDGDISANLSWSSSLDGVIGAGGSFSTATLSLGTHIITASVTDSGGLSDSDTVQVTIINVAPTVTITAPTDGSSFAQGANVSFTGTASDPGDGDLTAGLSWSSSIDGVIGSGGSFSTTALSQGVHTIIASVDDSQGWNGQDQITVTIVPPADDVTPGAASATVNGCDQITVSAPFTGDDNGDSTTQVEWSPNGVDTWATVPGCGSLSGASPRSCVHSSLTQLTSYWYRVTFSDADGVNGSNPQDIGPFNTPVCSVNDTSITSTSAEASSCRQIMVTSLFTGDGDGDGNTLVEYRLSGPNPWTTACNGGGPSPRQCLIPDLTATASYDIQVTFNDPDGVSPDNNGAANDEVVTPTGSPVTLPGCSGDEAPPMVIFQSPALGAVLGGVDIVRVQVWDAATATVEWSVDSENDADLAAAAININYDCGTDCAVYDFNLNTTTTGTNPKSLANGEHYLTIKATDGSGNISRVKRAFEVNNDGTQAAGAGNLLRRSHGSQMCIDCHNLKTHSSQSTDTSYGSWGIDCLTCHTPHGTTNIYLVRESIQTPNSGTHDVRLRSLSGVADYGMAEADGGANGDSGAGICETCHTRTKNADTSARYRNTGGGGNGHASGGCTGCHTHEAGFSGAGATCDSCHYAPPAVGKHGSHDQVGTLPTNWANATPTTTATQYGFACAKCHGGSGAAHFNDPATPHTVEVVFDTSTLPDNTGGAYTPDGPSQATDPGNNGDGWYWSDGSCANLYCHSNATPLGGSASYATLSWDQAAALSCVSCHDGGGAASGLSTAHRLHTEGGKYIYGCVRCHDATVSNNATVDDKRNHVDGERDVIFDATAPDNSGGAYDGIGYSCTNTYCHSDGKDLTAPFTSGPSIAWNTTRTCASCHDDADAAATNLSAAHFTHTETDGYAYGCERCHTNTVSNSTTIATFGNHVNAVQDVGFDSAGVDNSGGSYNAGGENCSNTYCHSNGTDLTAPYTSGPSIIWTNSGNCFSCHGSSGDGAPDYANGSPKENSHAAHVSSYACNVCHSNVVDATPTITDKSLHVNGAYNVAAGGGYNFTPSGSPTTCSSNDCHGDLTWGQTGVGCRNCHSSTGAGDQDNDDWVYGNGTTAMIDIDDWGNYGHGSASAYAESGNGAADFDSGGADGCLYCHSSGVAHNTGSNPFRLNNIGGGATAEDKNGVCTVCHGGSGFNPGSGAVDSALDVDAYHYGADHGGASGEDGGTFCWDCHDPHGDYNYGITQRLAYMVDETPTEDHSGSGGWGVPTTLATTPDFRANRDGTGAWGWGDYVTNTGGTPYAGVCQVCHDSADNVGKFNKTTYTAGHNPGNRCTAACHTHDQPPGDAFKGSGSCLDCHGSHIGPTGVSVERGQIVGGTAGTEGDDFIRPSRHVSDGTATEIVTDFDCILCHAEGDVSSVTGAISTNSTYHGADGGSTSVDLRDVDAVNGGGVAAQWPGSRLSGDGGAGTAHRDDMDSFCMGCHDSDTSSATASRGGAWGIAVNPSDSGMQLGSGVARRLTPFNTNDNLTNAREVAELDTWRTTNNRVIDVRGQFNYQNLSGRSWASHHNLNQFTKRYSASGATTELPGADAWTAYVTKEGENIGSVQEAAGLHCSDCHLNEANAHGTRNTWYMLSDASGTDTVFANGGTTSSTDICAKCHDPDTYGEGNNSTASRTNRHNASGSRCNRIAAGDVDGFAKLGWTGGGTSADNQLTCLGCHGGLEPGMIHGTNSTYVPGGGTASVPRYRFMGTGGSLRWYNPVKEGNPTIADWENANQGDLGCYTIGSADTWGACTQHSGAVDDGPAERARPLDY